MIKLYDDYHHHHHHHHFYDDSYHHHGADDDDGRGGGDYDDDDGGHQKTWLEFIFTARMRNQWDLFKHQFFSDATLPEANKIAAICRS